MARHMIPRAGPDELAEFGLFAHLGLGGSDLFRLEFLPLLDFIDVVKLRIVYPRLVSKATVFYRFLVGMNGEIAEYNTSNVLANVVRKNMELIGRHWWTHRDMIKNKAIEIIKHEYIDNRRFFVREVDPRLWLRLDDDDSFSFPVNMADDLPDGYWDNSDDNDSVTDEY